MALAKVKRASVQVTAAAGSQQQVARYVSPERAYVVFQRPPRSHTEADDPLLVPVGCQNYISYLDGSRGQPLALVV